MNTECVSGGGGEGNSGVVGLPRAERTDAIEYPLQESLATPPEKFVQRVAIYCQLQKLSGQEGLPLAFRPLKSGSRKRLGCMPSA